MNFTINPKPIIRREMLTAKRKVDTATSLFDLDVSVGEKVFINDRNVDYELIRDARGQYLDLQSETLADDSQNYVSITGASLGGDFSPIPVGTEIEFWVRLDEITTASNVPYMVRFGGSYRVGFMMSSGFIRFRPNWISVGGGVSTLADNGDGLVRVTTASAHGRNSGDTVYLTGVTGGSTITNLYYEVTVINSTTLDLQGSAFTGTPTGGTINQYIKFIVYDEDGIIQDTEDLATDVWYRVVLTTQNTTITLDGTGLHIGPYYRAARIHIRDFRITTPSDTIYWDFSTGLLTSTEYATTKTLVTDPDAVAGKVQFVDDELLGNDLDYIEQTSPYLLYRIKPQGGFVTPENFGASKQYNTANINDSVDATVAIQACIDSPYNVLIDGYYYVKDTLKVPLPKTIELIGSSDGTELAGRDETLGCLYQGSVPTDMFHIFSGAVHISGGLLDFRNCRYDTANAHLAAYYVPPVAIRYCFWANLIQNGSVTTTMIGEETETRKYNCGHIGVFFDNSRVHSGDPQTDTSGYGEMHYVYFKIECRFMYDIVDARLGEPYQDYTDIIAHASMGGFKVTTATLDEATTPDTWYISTTSSSYTVANDAWRILTLKWGTHSHFTIKVTSGGSSLVTLINQAIVDAGYSTDTSLASTTPAFKAETRVGGGTNQAFTIRSNQSTFKLTCCRPCLPTVFNYDLRDIGCKMGGVWETADNSNIDIFVQTGAVLSKAGTTIDGSEPSEWDYPKVTLSGENNSFDIYSIDLGKGNTTSPIYKTNIKAWKDIGETNEPIGESITSLNFGQAVTNRTHANVKGIIRNHRNFSHTRYHVGSGRDGFIGMLDNALLLANERYAVTTTIYDNTGFNLDTVGTASGEAGATATPSHATIANSASLFDTGGSLYQITYDSAFDEELDFIEVVIGSFGGSAELMSLFLEIYSTNRPRRIQVILTGSGGAALREFDLIGSSNNWLSFDGFNQNNTTSVILRLIGVKDKTAVVQLSQFAGKDKLSRHGLNPFLSIAGGTRIYNTTEFEGLKIKDGGSTYRTIVPQDATAITDYASLRAALIDAGIIY